MIVIDPLKYKILNLLNTGQPNPLDQARMRYGIESDIGELIAVVNTIHKSAENYFYIDLTPFERIGRASIIGDQLSHMHNPRPVFLIMSDNLETQFMGKTRQIPVPYVKFNEKGDYKSVKGGIGGDRYIKDSIMSDFECLKAKTIAAFRAQIIEKNMTDLLYKPGCLVIPRARMSYIPVEYLAGRYYIKMPNNMLVSCYLNLKEIGSDYKALIELAYEVVLILMEYFRRDVNALDKFDALIAPNNTALFLAAGAQAILEKSVICIDRLGPIPSLSLQRSKLIKELEGKKVVVLEEVMATGNEIDRVILFLNHLRVTISKIIALYDLDVGMALLTKPGQMISLCHPKRELKYEYRSL